MRIKKSTLYWCCQLGGWLFYGLSAIFFAIVFDNFDSRSYNILFRRIAISIFFGLLSTHLLRMLIQRLKLHPPMDVKKWWMLTMTVICVIILYSFANSATVEWLHVYDSEIKLSMEQRFVSNLFMDSPLVLVWASVYYIWHYVELGSKNEIQKIRLESLVKELELKTIKSHINPHFIFNALNSIRALVDENPERARTAITELSNILRSSMQAEKMETVPLEKELNIVKDYLALEHIRFEDRLQVSYDIDEDTLDQPVPPMMLQTLVENAIKHGISKQKSGGVIRIVSDFCDDHHELVVQNSGHLQDISNTGEGFGLSSTRNRLKLLYGGKASFDIRDTSQAMVEAVVKMPLAHLHS
ncbi:MAG TPA: histidine kinase [Sediminibacterium sp.]|nr:histidine kinase [Sediminibacterium sp.]